MRNVFLKYFFILLCTVITQNSATAASPEDELTAVLRDTAKVNTDTVLIYKDGKIVYEYYAREYTPKTKHLSWSTAKTMSGILIGIAESEGRLSFNDPVKNIFQRPVLMRE